LFQSKISVKLLLRGIPELFIAGRDREFRILPRLDGRGLAAGHRDVCGEDANFRIVSLRQPDRHFEAHEVCVLAFRRQRNCVSKRHGQKEWQTAINLSLHNQSNEPAKMRK
jgi:hypothetical protein